MFDFLGGINSVGINESYTLSDEDDMRMESYEEIECYDDPEDAFSRIAMEATENFYKLCEAVTVDEFSHYVATNEEMIYESGKISEIFESIKKFILNCWEKVKGVFRKVMDTIESALAQDKKFVEKYKSKVENFNGTIEAKGYPFDFKKLSSAACERILTKFDKIADIDKLISGVENDNGELKGSISSKSVEDIFGKDIEDVLRGSSIGEGKISKQDFPKKLKKYFFGSDDKETFKVTKQSAMGALDEIKLAKSTKASVRASYDANKMAFNTYIKLANTAKKEAIAAFGKKKAKESGITAAVGSWNKICKSAIVISMTVNRAQIKAINALRAQNKNIILQVVADMNSKKENSTTSTGESALDLVNFI